MQFQTKPSPMGPDVEIKPGDKLKLKNRTKRGKISLPMSSEKDISVVGSVQVPPADLLDVYSIRY